VAVAARSERGTTVNAKEEAALLAIFALRRAASEATNGGTANARFIDQEVLVALGLLERAFEPGGEVVARGGVA
jgi:hypothetical protein